MTLDLFLDLLGAHRAALRSTRWPPPHGAAAGPAFFLDAADTDELIAELTRIKRELARMGGNSSHARPPR